VRTDARFVNTDKKASSKFNLSIVIQKFIKPDRPSENCYARYCWLRFCLDAAISGI